MIPELTGVGIGLRGALVEDLLLERESVSELRWLECHPENYMGRGGSYARSLEKCVEHFPLATHGLAMSLGSEKGPSAKYLAELRVFLDAQNVLEHSDHVCLSTLGGAMTHDLLPMPMNAETVRHMAANVVRAQDALGRQIAIENISYYVEHEWSTMSEGAFVREIVNEAKCKLLLDVNNVYVNAFNHKLDAKALLDELPLDRVSYIHIAGHLKQSDELIIDTHSNPVIPEVHALLRYALSRTGPKPILLEWDDEFPPFSELIAEVRTLHGILSEVGEVRS